MPIVINQKGTTDYLINPETGTVLTFASQDKAEDYCKEQNIDLTEIELKDEKEMVTYDLPTENSPAPRKLEPTDQNIIDQFVKLTECNPKLGDSAKAMIVADKCNTSKSYVYAVLEEWTRKDN